MWLQEYVHNFTLRRQRDMSLALSALVWRVAVVCKYGRSSPRLLQEGLHLSESAGREGCHSRVGGREGHTAGQVPAACRYVSLTIRLESRLNAYARSPELLNWCVLGSRAP